MRFILPLVCFPAIALPLVAQDVIPADIRQAFEQYVKLPDALMPVLSGVKDHAGANASAAKLHGLLPQVYDTRDNLQKIQELSPEVAKAVRASYEREMREKWGDFYREIYRLQKANCYNSAAFAKEFHILCMMLNQ